MCQQIHLADVRLALRDYCEQRLDDEVTVRVDEVLAVFEDGEDDLQ